MIKVTASAGIPFTVKSLAWTTAGSTAQLRLISKVVGGVRTVPPQTELVAEQDMGVGVGVGVTPDWAQYLPPVFVTWEPSLPPHTIISLPVHTAV